MTQQVIGRSECSLGKVQHIQQVITFGTNHSYDTHLVTSPYTGTDIIRRRGRWAALHSPRRGHT